MPIGIVILGALMLIGGIFSFFWGLALSGVRGSGLVERLLVSDSVQSWGANAFGYLLKDDDVKRAFGRA